MNSYSAFLEINPDFGKTEPELIPLLITTGLKFSTFIHAREVPEGLKVPSFN